MPNLNHPLDQGVVPPAEGLYDGEDDEDGGSEYDGEEDSVPVVVVVVVAAVVAAVVDDDGSDDAGGGGEANQSKFCFMPQTVVSSKNVEVSCCPTCTKNECPRFGTI